MSEEIIKILDHLASKFGIAIDWTSANVAPYLKELIDRFISYEIATSIYVVLCLLFCVVVTAIFSRVSYPWAARVDFNPDEGEAWPFAISICILCLLSFFLILNIFIQGHDILTCYTLPEKIILEYLKNLMAKGGL